MSADAVHPLRLRLHGGRNTHALRLVHGDEGDYWVTPPRCGHVFATNDPGHWLPETATVTCPACVRAIGKESQ